MVIIMPSAILIIAVTDSTSYHPNCFSLFFLSRKIIENTWLHSQRPHLPGPVQIGDSLLTSGSLKTLQVHSSTLSLSYLLELGCGRSSFNHPYDNSSFREWWNNMKRTVWVPAWLCAAKVYAHTPWAATRECNIFFRWIILLQRLSLYPNKYN